MRSTMLNNPRLKNVFLVACGALLLLSIALFFSAMRIRDFGQQGHEALINGRAGVLLVISFVLLGGLALTLLVVLSRILNNSVAVPPNSRSRTRLKVPVAEPDAALSGESTGKPVRHIASTTQQDGSAQILSDAAGELRTSVGAIQEELSDMNDDDPVDHEHMQSLFEETDRLRKIIDGMEQLSRAQALAHSLRREPVQLEALLSDVVKKTRNTEQGKDVEFKLACEPGLAMNADPECLRIIMENLMDNAAKAVKNEGIVTLSASRKDDQVVFSVSDTGAGIRQKHLSHIYECFFRGTGIGIGMGLTIVKELVDACGGKIEVQTEPGRGSVFTVSIPGS
jgi:two-component system sensor histidine kinase BaeS